jgi:hypothetical protein
MRTIPLLKALQNLRGYQGVSIHCDRRAKTLNPYPEGEVPNKTAVGRSDDIKTL